MKLQEIVSLGTLIALISCSTPSNKTDTSSTNLSQPTHERIVEHNTIVSPILPEINIKVADEFEYIGKFDFEIIANSDQYPDNLKGKPVAAGERLVFAKSDGNKTIEKLFIVQFEGFLSSNDFIYNYNFNNADFIGANKYRHNTWYYDTRISIKENPLGESAKTDAFLKGKGFQMEDHFMMSRFVGLASEDRKNEIIIFYHEMLKNSTGYSLEEWEKSVPEEEVSALDSAFIARSKMSFEILD